MLDAACQNLHCHVLQWRRHSRRKASIQVHNSLRGTHGERHREALWERKRGGLKHLDR